MYSGTWDTCEDAKGHRRIGLGFRVMITVEEALTKVLFHSKSLNATVVSSATAAGLVLDEDVVSSENVPSFDNSAVDGYAVRSQDTLEATKQSPVRLTVIDRIFAGQISTKIVGKGQCLQLMTGAPMPSGADAVVKVEDTMPSASDSIDVLEPVRHSDNRRWAGDDIRSGQKLFDRGRRLNPYDTGLLASIGRTRVRVIRKPRVAILATGDELVIPDASPKPGQLRASTGIVLQSLLRRLNISHDDLGIVPDTPEATMDALRRAFTYDMVLSTGGVSMGEADHVREALVKLDVHVHFWRVSQRPGKPLIFASNSSTLFFGLPGNPVSSLVCFDLYVVPSLHALSGHTAYRPVCVDAFSETVIPSKKGLRRFIRGYVSRSGSGLSVRPLDNQSSGALSSMAFSNGLIDLAEDTGEIRPGDTVRVLITETESFLAEAYG